MCERETECVCACIHASCVRQHCPFNSRLLKVQPFKFWRNDIKCLQCTKKWHKSNTTVNKNGINQIQQSWYSELWTQRDSERCRSLKERRRGEGGWGQTEGEIYIDTQTYSQVRKMMASSCNADPLSGSGWHFYMTIYDTLKTKWETFSQPDP